MSTDIKKHKFIIIGSDHSNTLGQIRCLGEKGIRPIVVITEQKPYLITKSKYLGELHQVGSIAEAPRYVAEHWGSEPVKPFLYTDRDDFMCAIDKETLNSYGPTDTDDYKDWISVCHLSMVLVSASNTTPTLTTCRPSLS